MEESQILLKNLHTVEVIESISKSSTRHAERRREISKDLNMF